MNLFCFIKMKAREKGELLRQWTGPIRHSLSQRYLRLVWKNPRKLKKSSSANFSFQSSRNSFLYFSFLQNVLFSIVVKFNFGFGLTRISTRKIESSSLISVLNNFKDFIIETNFLNRNFNFAQKISDAQHLGFSRDKIPPKRTMKVMFSRKSARTDWRIRIVKFCIWNHQTSRSSWPFRWIEHPSNKFVRFGRSKKSAWHCQSKRDFSSVLKWFVRHSIRRG